MNHIGVINLKQLTIRGIPPSIEKLVIEESAKNGLSLNKAFISLLEKAYENKTNKKNKKVLCHELDRFCGMWNKDDYEVFASNLDIQRRVDEDLWK